MHMADDAPPMELERRYRAYCADFEAQAAADFFARHRHQEWFRDLYDPIRLAQQAQRRRADAKQAGAAMLRLADSADGVAKCLAWGTDPGTETNDMCASTAADADAKHEAEPGKPGGDSKAASADPEAAAKVTPDKPEQGKRSKNQRRRIEDKTCLFVMGVPPDLPRKALLSAFEDCDGYQGGQFSAVLRNVARGNGARGRRPQREGQGRTRERFSRGAWIQFDSEEHAVAALDRLHGQKVTVPAYRSVKPLLNVLSVTLTDKDIAEAVAAEGRKPHKDKGQGKAEGGGDATDSPITPNDYLTLSFVAPVPEIKPHAFTLNLQFRHHRPAKPLPAEAVTPSAVRAHLELATKLAQALDREFSVLSDVDAGDDGATADDESKNGRPAGACIIDELLAKADVETLGAADRLNVVTRYLRKVHCYCFYSSTQCGDGGQLISQTGDGYQPVPSDVVVATSGDSDSDVDVRGEESADRAESEAKGKEPKPDGGEPAAPTPASEASETPAAPAPAAAASDAMGSSSSSRGGGARGRDRGAGSRPSFMDGVRKAAEARRADAERMAASGKLQVEETADKLLARVAALVKHAPKNRVLHSFYRKYCLRASNDADEERHRCGFDDNKLFKSRSYVIKHLHNKHSAEANDALEAARRELRTGIELALVDAMLKKAYLADPKKPLPEYAASLRSSRGAAGRAPQPPMGGMRGAGGMRAPPGFEGRGGMWGSPGAMFGGQGPFFAGQGGGQGPTAGGGSGRRAGRGRQRGAGSGSNGDARRRSYRDVDAPKQAAAPPKVDYGRALISYDDI